MIIFQMPQGAYGTNTIIFVVGILIGILGIVLSGKVKDNKWSLMSKMTSVVMAIMMGVGLVGTVIVNIHMNKMELEMASTYIETTTEDLADRLTETTTVLEFDRLVSDLYQAEYNVVERTFEGKEDTKTVGELIVNGTGTEVGNYFGKLTEEERVKVLDTNKNSLETFTILEFAKLDSEIKTSSLKLGSTGSREVIANIGTQKEELDTKLDSLEVETTSIGKILTNILVINVAFILLSVVLTAVLYSMMVTMLDETNEIKRKYLEASGKEDGEDSLSNKEQDLNEFSLVNGELKDVSVNATEEVPKEDFIAEEPNKSVTIDIDDGETVTDSNEEGTMAEDLLTKTPEELDDELDSQLDDTVKDTYKKNIFKDKED